MSEAPSRSEGVIPSINLGKRLEIAREHAGMRQGDLANVLGIQRTAISKYEQEKQRPTRAIVMAWALATGVRFDWLSADDFPLVKHTGSGDDPHVIWQTEAA